MLSKSKAQATLVPSPLARFSFSPHSFTSTRLPRYTNCCSGCGSPEDAMSACSAGQCLTLSSPLTRVRSRPTSEPANRTRTALLRRLKRSFSASQWCRSYSTRKKSCLPAEPVRLTQLPYNIAQARGQAMIHILHDHSAAPPARSD